MAHQVVSMDYNVIKQAAGQFNQAKQILEGIGKILKVVVQGLKIASFLSLGATKALERYIEGIMKAVNNLAKVCGEFSSDLTRAQRDHVSGDYKGGQYFVNKSLSF